MAIVKIQKDGTTFSADLDQGIITDLQFSSDPDAMNWLISPDTLERYGYSGDKSKLLGKSTAVIAGNTIDTKDQRPVAVVSEDSVEFCYCIEEIEIRHRFSAGDRRLKWDIQITNQREEAITADSVYHWLPVQYVMHETREENMNSSCSLAPSISGDKSYLYCKKRSGNGPDLLVLNTGGRLRSVGSLCRYKNLFFEKSAPSLSGLVLFSAVNAYPPPEEPTVDWQYREMYEPVMLEHGETFLDSYEFLAVPPEQIYQTLYKEGFPVFHYAPVCYCGKPVKVSVKSMVRPVEFCLETADRHEVKCLLKGGRLQKSGENEYAVLISENETPGEQRLAVSFEDGTTATVIFTVYESVREMVLAFCEDIYQHRFIDDPSDPNYCGYQSTSRQGEACAKGSLLLLKNLLMEPNGEEIRQVEKNAVYYLKGHWLDNDFCAVKQYPGGFARIIDMDYLILEFYLLSKADNKFLAIHTADEYLLWAYRTSIYRLTDTPDKLPREAVEVRLSSIISWIQVEMISELSGRGFEKEAKTLEDAWISHIEIQESKIENLEYVETEHYFDNAGISTFVETMMHSGAWKSAMPAARLLLANVADSTDYRNYAPDRWWEAVAPMYHNLWAAFTSKALLTVYETSGQKQYLEPAYRSMMPMFYNYDWRAVSAPNRFEKGQGTSAYCLTNPNLNTCKASRNRFGQSIFEDEFFSQIDVSGDDWDLGMDMVVYLYSFGQKTFVIGDMENYRAINGQLEYIEGGAFTVTSDAVFPTEYTVSPWNLTIKRRDPGVFIRSVTFKEGRCVKIELEGVASEIPVEIRQNGILINDENLLPNLQWVS